MAFERQIGRSVGDLVGHVVPGNTRRAALLTGSLAECIGGEVSDVDLMVVIDGEYVPVLPPFGDATVKTSATGGLEIAIVDSVIEGLEVDIALISGERLWRLCKALGRGGVMLAEDDIRVLARLKRGWLLDDPTGYGASLAGLRDGLSLEVFCATTYFSLALKRLEDAFAAAAKDAVLALHLGRLCVEQAFFAWLAAKGTSYPGAKWIGHVRRIGAAGHGLALLFPAPADDVLKVEYYLREVQRFVCDIRALIERDRAFRIAFDFCPQIYVPDFGIESRT